MTSPISAASLSGPLATATTPTAATAATKTPTKTEAKARDLETASREFEAIFVRSMMKNSVGGKGDAYGDMAVDAVAKSITAGKGIGLGELIRHAIEKSENPLKSGGR